MSPDYVLVHPSKVDELTTAFKQHIATFHPQGCLRDEKGYTRIVSPGHFARLSTLLDNTKGEIAVGGGRDEKTLRFETTVVTDVKDGDSLLSELSMLTLYVCSHILNIYHVGRYSARSYP